MADKLLKYRYVLVKQFQPLEDGKVIHTSLNMDNYKDFDSFADALLKAKAITKEEREEFVSSYYGKAYDDHLKSLQMKLAVHAKANKKGETNGKSKDTISSNDA